MRKSFIILGTHLFKIFIIPYEYPQSYLPSLTYYNTEVFVLEMNCSAICMCFWDQCKKMVVNFLGLDMFV